MWKERALRARLLVESKPKTKTVNEVEGAKADSDAAKEFVFAIENVVKDVSLSQFGCEVNEDGSGDDRQRSLCQCLPQVVRRIDSSGIQECEQEVHKNHRIHSCEESHEHEQEIHKSHRNHGVRARDSQDSQESCVRARDSHNSRKFMRTSLKMHKSHAHEPTDCRIHRKNVRTS